MTNTTVQIDQKSGAGTEPRHLPEMLVVFYVGSIRLGIDIGQVREIARAVPLSEPPPNRKGVAGMIVLRGESTAVVDLAAAFGLPKTGRDRRARMIAVRHGDETVCLLVDGVDGLLEVTRTDLEQPPELVAGAFAGWLDFVTQSVDGYLVGVINVQRVLAHVLVDGLGETT